MMAVFKKKKEAVFSAEMIFTGCSHVGYFRVITMRQPPWL